MHKLPIGIIGYGPYGQNLARLALNTTRFDIKKIYSWAEDPATLQKITDNGFQACSDVDELINDSEIQAVIVASPNKLHHEHILKVCKAGKALWAEKPLVLDLDECKEVVAAVETSQIISHCNMSMRYRGIPRQALELQRKGGFGKLMHFISRSCRGVGLFAMNSAHKAVLSPELSGGWIMHHMCHQVDYAMQLFNEPVKQVYAQSIKSAPECPSEESISAVLTFESGGIAELSDGLAPMGDHFFSIIGSNGSAYEDHGQLQFCNQLEGNDYGQGGSAIVYKPEAWADDSLMAFYAAVTQSSAGRNYELTRTPVDAYMCELLQVELAICQSAQSGTVIKLNT